MPDCSICISECTSKVRAPVTCPFCSSVQCLQCAKKCILMWASDPKCANCNKAFTSDLIDATFSKGFRRGELRKQVIQNLVEQEQSLLPNTMQLIEARRASVAGRQAVRVINRIQEDFFQNTVGGLYSEPMYQDFLAEHRRLFDIVVASEYHSTTKKTEVHRRTIKCPGAGHGGPEGCNGYIFLSGPGANTCALCDTKVCRECNHAMPNAAAVEAHKTSGCNADDVASVQAIRDSTVPCPKCGTAIQKISGCNQMWCTARDCNTAFDWSTGRIVNGPIHNPHYHEWLRQGGGGAAIGAAPANVECQGPTALLRRDIFAEVYSMLEPTFKHASGAESRVYSKLVEILRSLPEAVDRFPINIEPYTQQTYEPMRIAYLEGRYATKEIWASKLSHAETLRIKRNHFKTLLTMLFTASSDLFGHLLTTLRQLRADPESSRLAKVKRNEVVQDVRIVRLTAALEPIQTFLTAFETLRVYYIRQALRIVSDYSDQTLCVPVYDPVAGYLLWSDVSVKSLTETYKS